MIRRKFARVLVSSSTIPGYVLRYRSHAMDGVYSILAGLGVRVVVDAATWSNVKLSGTLIGLWEGVVLLHYVKKAPGSTDPYLAYAVRLFVDFLVTESVFKLVIVLLWSTMGMVLADIAPSVWADLGLRRQWSRMRRDLYVSTRMFSKRRTVRFVSTPTIGTTAARSTASSAESSVDAESTVGTTLYPPSTTIYGPSTTVPTTAPSESILTLTETTIRPVMARRRSSVPGTFPGAEMSESETDGGSVPNEDESEGESQVETMPIFSTQSSHVTIARIIPPEPSEDTYTFTSSPRSSSPTYSLEYSDDPSADNPVDIPSDLEEEVLVHSHRRLSGFDDHETTPKQILVVLPPTFSESLQDWESSHATEEVPPSPWMPLIPDHEPLDEWETVNAQEEPSAPPEADVIFRTVSSNEDNASIGAPSTIAPEPALGETAVPDVDLSEPLPVHIPAPPLIFFDGSPPITIPVPDPVPPEISETIILVPETVQIVRNSDGPSSEAPLLVLQPLAPDPSQDPPAIPVDTTIETPTAPEPPAPQQLLDAGNSSHHLYGPDPPVQPTVNTSLLSSRPATPPVPSPSGSLSRALARIASLDRQRKSSLSEGGSAAASAVLAKKELADVNNKAAGAFVGLYNPPSASLYEFNTTGLTPDEAVTQTEARLEKLLLTQVPPVGTRPEDMVHDSPNRGALKVVLEQSIKGRLVKQKLLVALTDSGLNWFEETSRPNVVHVLLPVSAAAEEPASASAAAEDKPPKKADEDDDDAKEY
ncbi:hypothetical protein R3P38DRAFT_2903743 [Favolaschia claudopus]|uniref:Uncharacterized protein n=1 Tax=Favolaschia claudopus TaxID=2862362 RepID=A0AAW0CCV8_9AGAR